mgnify:CR=1 FL=1
MYNKAFAVFWEQRTNNAVHDEPQHIHLTIELDEDGDAEDDGSSDSDENEGETITLRFSAVETLRKKDLLNIPTKNCI